MVLLCAGYWTFEEERACNGAPCALAGTVDVKNGDGQVGRVVDRAAELSSDEQEVVKVLNRA